MRPISRCVVAGARPATRMPTVASGVSTTRGRPASTPSTILRAARSASMDSSGAEAPAANQAYSAPWSPVNLALRCEPVRMSPGATVVTLTPVPTSSARRPCEKPTAPNLAVEYGSRCGTLTKPPTEVTVAIRPRPRSRIRSATARAQFTGPQSMVSTASSKCSRVIASRGPTWMTPATVMRTSMGATVASTRCTRARTAASSVTSQTSAVTSTPRRRRSSAAARRASPSRAQISRRWPRRPSSRASSSPRPREAPATNARGLSAATGPRLVTRPVCGPAGTTATAGHVDSPCLPYGEAGTWERRREGHP